ncbi:MAG: hypothetical protein EA403_10185 [Spirochaetaceae bacterium]|nr:MAG: hypothetical protein EA403_10185 [Spirochaetaceae bacterium]
MSTWKQTAEEIRAAAADIQLKPDDDISRVLRYNMIDSGAGNDGSLSSWMFACGDVRHVGAYCYYIIWFTQYNQTFSLDQLKDMMRNWTRQAAEFAGYVGFKRLWGFVQQVVKSLESVESKDQIVELANALWTYANNLNAWIYHYMPWGIGALIPRRDADYFREALRVAETQNSQR